MAASVSLYADLFTLWRIAGSLPVFFLAAMHAWLPPWRCSVSHCTVDCVDREQYSGDAVDIRALVRTYQIKVIASLLLSPVLLLPLALAIPTSGLTILPIFSPCKCIRRCFCFGLAFHLLVLRSPSADCVPGFGAFFCGYKSRTCSGFRDFSAGEDLLCCVLFWLVRTQNMRFACFFDWVLIIFW